MSAQATQALAKSELFAQARIIALYVAKSDEADPAGLEDWALHQNARVVYPRVEGSILRFYFASKRDLVPSPRLSLLEPLETFEVAPVLSIDLFVVPGLGFSERGHRLGYGGGYYDRTIRFARTQGDLGMRTVAFAFESQVQTDLPTDPYDEHVDALVTESGLRMIRRKV